ncbi:MAG: DUF692 family multinuclear iron-containing protein [Chloroflexota bacterium]
MSPQPWPAAHGRPLLGANGTEAMTLLLDQGGGDLVDYLKVGPFMGRPAIAALADRHALLLHLDDTLSAHPPLDPPIMKAIADWVALTGTPWASEHIAFDIAGIPIREALRPQPAGRALSRAQALENIVTNARALAATLPVPLILENVPLYPNRAHLHVAAPDFVAEVLARTGFGLLLDLAHARVTASLLGLDMHAYLEALPLERVVELHLSGPRPVRSMAPERQAAVYENAATIADVLPFGPESLVDVHELMAEEDYALLAWTLERARPRAISLEYYRDAAALRVQLERLNAMLGR